MEVVVIILGIILGLVILFAILKSVIMFFVNVLGELFSNPWGCALTLFFIIVAIVIGFL